MLYLEENTLRIQVYEKLLRISETQIIVKQDKKILTILGTGMVITFFEKDEIIIHGHFTTLTWKEEKK